MKRDPMCGFEFLGRSSINVFDIRLLSICLVFFIKNILYVIEKFKNVALKGVLKPEDLR